MDNFVNHNLWVNCTQDYSPLSYSIEIPGNSHPIKCIQKKTKLQGNRDRKMKYTTVFCVLKVKFLQFLL